MEGSENYLIINTGSMKKLVCGCFMVEILSIQGCRIKLYFNNSLYSSDEAPEESCLFW